MCRHDTKGHGLVMILGRLRIERYGLEGLFQV